MSMTIAPSGAAMPTAVPAVLQPQPVTGGGPSAQLHEALLALHGALGALRGALEGAAITGGGGPTTGGGPRSGGCACMQGRSGEAMLGAAGAPEAPPAAERLKERDDKPAPPPAPPAPAAVEDAVAPKGFKLVHPLPGANLSSHYGEVSSIREHRPHTGTDFAKPSGSPILAAAPGRVAEVGFQADGLGHYIKIDHGNGWMTSYGHMVEKSPLAKGAVVKAGEQIGKVGSTGNSTGPHLHFMVYENGKHTNPEPFLSGQRTLA